MPNAIKLTVILSVLSALMIAIAGQSTKKTLNPNTQDEVSPSDILSAQETLAEFGYGTTFTALLDDRTREALKLYQRRSSLPASGELDRATTQRLWKDELDLKRSVEIPPNYMFGDSNWNDFFWAKGIWQEHGKELNAGSPIIAARVECVKSMGVCIVASGGVFTADIRLAWFEIERWDNYEITTKPYDLPCGRETLQISRPDKSVLTINTAAYKDITACEKLFGKPIGPAVNHLSDGDKIIHARWAAVASSRERVLLIPPEAKERLKSK